MSTDAAPTRLSRPLIIVLAVAVLAVLVYLLVVVLGQNGVEDVGDTGAIVASEPAAGSDTVPEPDPQMTEEPTDDIPPEPSFEVFDARDPFDQLVADTSTGPVGDTSDTAATTPAPTPGPTPGAPQDGAPVDSGPSQTTVASTTIRLDDVFRDGSTDKVIVEVNGSGYEAAEGDTVAGDLTVLDVEDSCATMRYRDSRFILCEGEQIQK